MRVDWNDAGAFAGWVNGRSGGGYRRPTEAEWEYAARAGTSTRWSFGDAESQLGAYAWFGSNSGSKTQPVGGKAGNPWGLFDMHGNVWEWVEDCYVNSYSGLATSGAANTTGGCALRVFRGGSWYDGPQSLRSADRSWDTPSDRDSSVGFRLSRTL
jgi:formylglycine-generating enzyme required for sulfatase activity